MSADVSPHVSLCLSVGRWSVLSSCRHCVFLVWCSFRHLVVCSDADHVHASHTQHVISSMMQQDTYCAVSRNAIVPGTDCCSDATTSSTGTATYVATTSTHCHDRSTGHHNLAQQEQRHATQSTDQSCGSHGPVVLVGTSHPVGTSLPLLNMRAGSRHVHGDDHHATTHRILRLVVRLPVAYCNSYRVKIEAAWTERY